MKAAILVWVVGYFPLAFVFDTHSACHEFEDSLKRQADRHSPTEIFINGHQPTLDFTPCITLEIIK